MRNIYTKDGLALSQLSLGCMNLPLKDEIETEKIIEYALSEGINYFDTADLYQFGDNEKVVGRILEKYRNTYQFYVGTKVGNEFDMYKRVKTGWNPGKTYIKEQVKSSLKRLGVDVIDLYQLHGGTIEDDMDVTISAFEELKHEGIIRSYGLSSIRLNVIDYYKKNSNINTLMMQFNPIDNRPLEIVDDLNGVTLLARGPLFKGVFSHNMENVLNQKFQEGFLSLSKEDLQHTIRHLQTIDEDLARLSYRFLSYHRAVIVNGVSNFQQLERNIQSFNDAAPLSHDEYAKIYDALKILNYEDHRT